jgi:hypothetical protein
VVAKHCLDPLGMALDLDLDLDLLLDDGPPVDDDGSGFFATRDAGLLGRLGLTDDPAPDCEWGEGEAAADLRAPPTASWACGCDGLLKISGTCDNPTSRLGVMLFLGTSHKRSISSHSLTLSLFECFAPFLPFRHRRSNASTSLSVRMSAKSRSTI